MIPWKLFCALLELDYLSNSYFLKIGGALKERRDGRAGKRSSKRLKMDNNKLSTKNPQLDSPEKIQTFWIKATCDSRFCVLDAFAKKTNSLEFTDGLPRHGPSDWDKVTKHERSVFRFLIFIWNRTHALPWRQEWTPRNTAKLSASEMQGGTRNFFGQSFRTKNVLSKTCQWTLQNAVMDSPFCSWTVRSAEKRIFGENFSSPTDDFGGSKMRGYCLGQVFVVPILALVVCVSTVEWRFLLWAVNNHLNKKPSRTAIRLCARCTLEEGC